MRVLLSIWMMVCWIGVGGWTCLAMMEISAVTPEAAKKMGIVVTSQAAGPGAVWVTLKFKKEGAFEHYGPERYSRVELRMNAGEQPVVIAGLKEKRSKEGAVEVSLMVGREQLDSTALMVVVGAGVFSGGGFEVQLKDFVDLEAIDAARAKAAAAALKPVPVPVDTGLPAATGAGAGE